MVGSCSVITGYTPLNGCLTSIYFPYVLYKVKSHFGWFITIYPQTFLPPLLVFLFLIPTVPVPFPRQRIPASKAKPMSRCCSDGPCGAATPGFSNHCIGTVLGSIAWST